MVAQARIYFVIRVNTRSKIVSETQMKLRITQPVDQSIEDQPLLNATVGSVLMGQIDTQNIQVFNSGEGIALDVVKEDLASQIGVDRSLLMVTFQFKLTPNAGELKQYVDDRNRALCKHQGRVVLSCVTERSDDWQFDGLEIIDFPGPDTIQKLMQDDDYRNSTADSGSVFGGDFAVAQLIMAS
ncbi:MAG: hypothetical protein ACJA13_001663 [Paraglaciecola sp.]